MVGFWQLEPGQPQALFSNIVCREVQLSTPPCPAGRRKGEQAGQGTCPVESCGTFNLDDFTSISEGTFSWFRHYARTVNEMSWNTHRFLVHLYVLLHNEMILKGKTGHLNKYSKPPVEKKPSVPYPCNKRRVSKE